MRTAFFLAAVALVAAAPATLKEEEEEEEPKEQRPILILLDDRTPPEGATYAFAFETENGIAFSEVGVPGSRGQSNVRGVYRYIQDDGTVAEVRYVADERGFRPQSSLLPVAPKFPHPIPLFVQEQIAFAHEQHRLRALLEEQQQTQLEEQQQTQQEEQQETQQEEQQQTQQEEEEQEEQGEEKPLVQEN